jgi:hypothetical protein
VHVGVDRHVATIKIACISGCRPIIHKSVKSAETDQYAVRKLIDGHGSHISRGAKPGRINNCDWLQRPHPLRLIFISSSLTLSLIFNHRSSIRDQVVKLRSVKGTGKHPTYDLHSSRPELVKISMTSHLLIHGGVHSIIHQGAVKTAEVIGWWRKDRRSFCVQLLQTVAGLI